MLLLLITARATFFLSWTISCSLQEAAPARVHSAWLPALELAGWIAPILFILQVLWVSCWIAVTAFLCPLCWCRHPSVGKETSTASGGTLPPEAGGFYTCLMACCTTNLERKAGNTFAQFCLDFSPESGYFLSLRVTST